jgi:hypothetical protein
MRKRCGINGTTDGGNDGFAALKSGAPVQLIDFAA